MQDTIGAEHAKTLIAFGRMFADVSTKEPLRFAYSQICIHIYTASTGDLKNIFEAFAIVND